MLILTRKPGQVIRIGDDISVQVLEIGNGQVSIGIDAPDFIPVDRQEVWERKKLEQIREIREK